MSRTPVFKRVVFGMHHGTPDDDALRSVAEFAKIMQMSLLGLYAEDPQLIGLAALPFVREFRPLGGGWRPLDVDRLSREIRLAAECVEQQFARTAEEMSIDSDFMVVKGSASNMIATISEAGDIVVVAEPTSPADRATHQPTMLAEAAFRSAAAVLFLPHRVARRTGPIVAIATEAGDLAVRAAIDVATAVGEKLVLVATDPAAGQKSALGNHNGPIGLEVERLAPKLARLTDAVGVCSAVAHVAERLVVMTRGAFDDAVPAMVAAMRHVPVLVVEPPARRDPDEAPSTG